MRPDAERSPAGSRRSPYSHTHLAGWPAATGRIRAVIGLLVGGFGPAPCQLVHGFQEAVDLRCGVVGSEAGPHRARQRLPAPGGDVDLDRSDLFSAHVQQMEDIGIGAEAAMTHRDAPLMTQRRSHQSVVQAIDDEAREGEAARRAWLRSAKDANTLNGAESLQQTVAQANLVLEHFLETELEQR